MNDEDEFDEEPEVTVEVNVNDFASNPAPAAVAMDEDESGVSVSDEGEELTFSEARVLGCLIEKESTTPDHYPMTLNALQSACNQKSSRDPVTDFDELLVERALEGLRGKGLTVMVRLSGSRVPKYKHTIDRVYNLDPAQQALVCVFLLRGIQTAGELNQRTDRIHKFGSVDAVEHTLGTLIAFPAGPLVVKLPPGAKRRVTTYAHLLCGEPDLDAATSGGSGKAVSGAAIALEEEASWRKKMEDEVATLHTEVAQLKSALDQFKQQFES